jgi:hypothetical protein
VLYHSLEGDATYNQYIQDAQEASDEEFVDFFTLVRDEDSMRADEAQILLAERTPTAGSPFNTPTTEERPADVPARMGLSAGPPA